MQTGRLVLLSIFALGGATTGCAGHHPPGADCRWPAEDHSRALSDDAELAEDIAIRYADRVAGPGSGNFENIGQYGRTRDGCMGLLFRSIAASHSVTEQDVRESLGRRRLGFDLAVMLSFALVFGWGVSRVTRAVIRTHLSDNGTHLSDKGWIASFLMIAFVAAVAGVLGVLAGEQWGTTMESLRLGAGHLSYRVDRLPWVRHRAVVFWACAGLVGTIAVVQYRRASGLKSVP